MDEFCAARDLNSIFMRNVESYFLDYAARLSQRAHASNRPVVVGLNGAQGSGKSTLSELLA
jgi:D-glycerate 3-kinase